MNITDKRTKLVATIGPASDSVEVLTKLAQAGMTTIRANFSHGDREEQFSKMKKAWEVQKTLNRPISVLLDTKGHEIRVGKIGDGAISVANGEILKVLTGKDDFANHNVLKENFQFLLKCIKTLKKAIKFYLMMVN